MTRVALASGTPAELVRSPSPEFGLVVAPDIMGLRPLFDQHCERLSVENNWTVCAPEPFAGQEDLELEARLDTVRTLDDERQLSDLVAAADATGCDQVGIIGFCMGGMYALKASATGRFAAAVSFYGMIRVPEQFQGPGQGEPLAAVTAPDACPVLALVGTVDPWTPPADVDALAATGATVIRYEGADHGFVHDPDRPAHRADDAADAWGRAIRFLSAGYS